MNDPDGVFEARAYIHGNKVIVRADHLEFSSMQLLKHELGHHKIRTGKVDMKKVYDAIEDFATEGYAQYVIESYVNAYATLEGYDADYILEEILCDYEAGMNIFSEEDASSLFWEMAQEVLQSDAVKADSARGPPIDGRTSRESARVNAFFRHFTGAIKTDEYISLSNVEAATIKSNIKSRATYLNKDASGGLVWAHSLKKEYAYVFICNPDYSVTVTDVYDADSDIDTINRTTERMVNYARSGSDIRRNSRDNGQQRNGNQPSYTGSRSDAETSQSQSNKGMVEQSSQSIRQGSMGPGSENRANSGTDTSRDTSKIKFMQSSYGKDGIQGYVATAKTENRVFYAGKRIARRTRPTPASNLLTSSCLLTTVSI